jgi:hypothetical protein
VFAALVLIPKVLHAMHVGCIQPIHLLPRLLPAWCVVLSLLWQVALGFTPVGVVS